MSDRENARDRGNWPPDVTPVFPLPDHVLLPASPAPYRIFEPRYRALVEHLLKLPEAERWLAVPRLTPGWRAQPGAAPAFASIATVGRLLDCKPNIDGVYHVVVGQGVRCRLEETPSPHPFRLARVTHLPDLEGDETPAELAAAFDSLLQVVAALAQTLGSGARGLVALAQERTSVGERVFRLGSALIQHPDRRQQFLECRRQARRIDLALDAAGVLLTLAAQQRGGAGFPRS